MTKTSQALIIFEGPDGSGKTTAALQLARDIDAHYVHLGPLPNVKSGHLARFYVEAMLPAVLGHRPVVMDRSWLSEPIYGQAFRQGANRLTPEAVRMLERLAWRCQTHVVLALPPEDTVLANFMRRRQEEYLTLPRHLQEVYRLYRDDFSTSLTVRDYDYTQGPLTLDAVLDETSHPHPLHYPSAGNLAAKVLLVGESFAHHSSADPLYQWPFASFGQGGCSHWLATQLIEAGIWEHELCWLNADSLTEDCAGWLGHFPHAVALGNVAYAKLKPLVPSPHLQAVPHPQYWKRFGAGGRYPLIDLLKGLR